MRIAIVSPDYPSETSAAFAFVHVRAKLYQELGNEVAAFIRSPDRRKLMFEGIATHRLPRDVFVSTIRRFGPDVIAVYYPTVHTVPLLRELAFPKVAWILGHEALWSLSLMPSRNSFDWVKKRTVLLPRLAYQLYAIRGFLQQVEACVFVSEWLLKTVERHTRCRFARAVVIPNPVDTQLFSYRQPEALNSGVSVRSLERTVYGLDVAIKAFAALKGISLTIFGKGRFADKFTRMSARLHSNATIRAEYVPHDRLPELFHRFGFFVAPSRAETQGLAMCEAMACGLPVVASRVGGIPEFVRDGIDGYLVPPDDPKALRAAVQRLVSDRRKFLDMSGSARRHIESKCSADAIAAQELAVLKRALSTAEAGLCRS